MSMFKMAINKVHTQQKKVGHKCKMYSCVLMLLPSLLDLEKRVFKLKGSSSDRFKLHFSTYAAINGFILP